MPKIPLYERSVTPTTEVGGAMMSPESEAAPFAAVAQLGGQVAQVGFEYEKRMKQEEGEAQIASYYADRKRRANAIKETISSMQDPDEIQKIYTAWREEEDRIFSSSDLTREAQSVISNNNEGFYADIDIAASGYNRKARIGATDRAWIDVQNMAMNNETDPSLRNEDGSIMSSSQLYEYATSKRIDLGTVDYEDGQNDIRSFEQNRDYRQIVALADNNPDEADGLLGESNLTGEKLILATDAIRDARDLRDRKIKATQDSATNEINKEMQSKRLSRSQLNQMAGQTEVVMGKEVPLVPKDRINAYMQQLDQQEDVDYIIGPDRFDGFKEFVKKVVGEGRLDRGQKETDKMYKQILGVARGGASKASVETMLNTANAATTQYAEGRGWSKETVDAINYMTDAYTTMYTDMPTKYKSADPVGSIITKLDSFIKMVEEHGGTPPVEAIREWERLNGVDELRHDVSLNTYIKNYRIGERDPALKSMVYLGDGEWESREL